jgi:hypothetical protein
MKFFDRSSREPNTTPHELSDTPRGGRTRRALAAAADRLAEERRIREKEMLKYEREAQRSREMRREFLERSGAYPASPDLYALWLYAYLEQGNKITYPRDYPFSRGQLEKDEIATQQSLASIGPNGVVFEDKEVSYYDQNVVWVPTKSCEGNLIPTGYGSDALTIMYLPDLVNLDTRSTSGSRHPGSEYGHSKLLTLKLDESSPTGLRASTNEPDVESYTDITDMIMGFTDNFDPAAIRQKLKDAKNRPGQELEQL